MRRRTKLSSVIWGLFLALFISIPNHAAGAKENAGLRLTISSGTAADRSVSPNISLFVQAGQAAGPFVPKGKFTAVWEGNLSAELRGDFAFEAELNGDLKLEINGNTVLALSGKGTTQPLSKFVQLNKGTNPLKATFASPKQGDAFVRLAWTEKAPYTAPIPVGALTHTETPELKKGLQLRQGRELFLEHRCANCHTTQVRDSVPEFQMDAPTLEGIGARRNHAWIAKWILDPKATRTSVHMPKLLNGSDAKEQAEAIAASLATLKTGGDVSLLEPNIKSKPANLANNDAPANEEQKPLFERLNCAACHNPPGGSDAAPVKIGLKHVAQKFAPGKLAEFLRAPEAHFAWIRMPNFHLSTKEAAELAEFLLASAQKPATQDVPTDAAMVNKGRTLIQETGCLNCHNAKIENKFVAPGLQALTAEKWNQGCLAVERKPGSKAPVFGFSAEQTAALKIFGQTDRQSLTRHAPSEFASRQTRLLNCAACHGQAEGFPPLETLGEKLKPEWAAQFIAGQIAYKPRAELHPRGEPWLPMRMPAFKSRAEFLAKGLAAEHGYAPVTAPESPVDMELAKLGQKLVGKDGGFSCVSCHGAGKMEAMEVFESEGINLAYSAERLLPAYYRRWLRNPLSIDPQTKMPAYFEEGKSPLTEVLEGNADKQINAIWHYIRLGSKMPPPAAEQ